MARLGVTDVIESGDGDVFAFGASGILLKSVGGDGNGAWSLEVVDIDRVSKSIGFGQQGWIAIATLSGCDFFPSGMKGIGLEKAIQCVSAMVKHCESDLCLKQFIISTLEHGLPNELHAYASLSGCKTSIMACSGVAVL